ncbi:unnamed protein product [Trichobilharzia regenti]|nr:unnamed protein product [Trichobilharzia regenti]
MFITIPDTFATYPETYEMNTEQTPLTTYFHTTLSSISVKNLQSLGLYDTSLSISNRSVRLTAYFQISTRSLFSERFEARIAPTGMNVTVATCESAVYKYSNFVSECSLVVGDIEFMNQIEMVKYFNVQLIVPFLSSGLFTLNSSSVTPTYAEIHHVEYLYVDKDNSNAIRNIRLISDYILGASNTRRFEANTILGIFENNKTSLSDTYNFRVGIKFYFNAAVTVGSVISIRFQVTASSTSLPRVQKNVPITSIIMPPTTAPLSKYPILTLRKIDPYYSKPMVQFTTTLEARVRFMMDFLYSPIVIQLNSTGGTLYRHAVFTVGHILDTTTPIGLPIITGARLARLTIQSVYYNETCNDGRCEIAVRYSLYLDSNSPILVTSVVLFGTLPVVKTENITPQVYNASFLTVGSGRLLLFIAFTLYICL